MSETTLIQLVSEQTMQNLLPVLRLKPQRLIHLVTPKTAAKSEGLRAAARAAGVQAQVETIRLSDMPDIPECFHAVKDSIIEHSTSGSVIVNFTGGTKLMSIGAFAAAQEARTPSLYVDTQDSCFVDGATSSELNETLHGDWSFTPIQKQLRVDVLGIANGVPRITAGKPWQEILPLATALFESIADEQATHDALHGPQGLFPRGMEPRKPQEWLLILQKPIILPQVVADMAVKSNLVRPGNSPGQVFFPNESLAELEYLANNKVPDFIHRYYQAVAPLQHVAAFLSGGWWEVIVCDAAHKSGRFRDLRWSSYVGDRKGPDTEEDLLAVDGVELLYVNCKRGGARARLLPLLEEVRARAATIGGSFNRRYLAVLQAPEGKVASNLEQQAKRLGIRVITGKNVYQSGIFDK